MSMKDMVDGMMGGMMGMMMGMGWLAALLWLVVVVGLILLAVWLVRRLSGPDAGSVGAGAGSVAAESPLAILQRRYAGGEIGREEYERVRADLLRDQASR
jgi:putative membrane protein